MSQVKDEATLGPALKKRIVPGATGAASAVSSNGYRHQVQNSRSLSAKTSYGKKRNGNRQTQNRRSSKHKKLQGEPTELVDGWQEVLQKQYANNPYPTSEDYDRLALETGMERRLVPRWFINMRKGGMSKAYSDSGSRTSTSSPRRSKANHSILKVEGDLEKEFEIHPYPTPAQYQQLATRLKVEKKLVRRWFISRRRTKAQAEQEQQKQKEEKNAGGAAGDKSLSLSKLSKTTSDGKVSSSPGGTAKDYGQSSGSNSTTSSPSSIDSNNTLNDHLTSKLKTQNNKAQLTGDGGNSGHGTYNENEVCLDGLNDAAGTEVEATKEYDTIHMQPSDDLDTYSDPFSGIGSGQNDTIPLHVNLQSIDKLCSGQKDTASESPPTYSYTDPDGRVVSVVQAVGIDDIDSNELAAAISGSNFNGQYAVGTYIDDDDLEELTKHDSTF